MSGRVINDLDIENAIFSKLRYARGGTCTITVKEILKDLNKSNGLHCIYAHKDPRGSQQIRKILLKLGFTYIPADSSHGTGKYRIEGYKFKLSSSSGVVAAC